VQIAAVIGIGLASLALGGVLIAAIVGLLRERRAPATTVAQSADDDDEDTAPRYQGGPGSGIGLFDFNPNR
jgi:hypothetical protein